MKTIKIKELKIEVETELREKVYKKDLKIPKGWRLLTFSEFAYISENDLLPLVKEDRQWGTSKGKVAVLDSVDFGDWLGVDANYGGGFVDRCSFGVRFCGDLKKVKK
jgi:hypothetical protein